MVAWKFKYGGKRPWTIGAEKVTGHLLSPYWVPDIVMGAFDAHTLSLSFCFCSLLKYPNESNVMGKECIQLTVQGTIHQCGKSQGSRSLKHHLLTSHLKHLLSSHLQHLLALHPLSRNNTGCFLVLSWLSPFCVFWNALLPEWSWPLSRWVFPYQLTPSSTAAQRTFFQGNLDSSKSTMNINNPNPCVLLDSFSIVKEGAEAIPIKKTGKQAEVEATWSKSPRQKSGGNEMVSTHGSSEACRYNYNPIELTCMGYFSQLNFLFPESYGSLCSIYDAPLQLLLLSFFS